MQDVANALNLTRIKEVMALSYGMKAFPEYFRWLDNVPGSAGIRMDIGLSFGASRGIPVWRVNPEYEDGLIDGAGVGTYKLYTMFHNHFNSQYGGLKWTHVDVQDTYDKKDTVCQAEDIKLYASYVHQFPDTNTTTSNGEAGRAANK